jgi:hypothetical protein
MPSIASLRARRRAATAGERGVGSGQQLSTGACDRGPLVATRRGVSHHRRVEPGNRNTGTTTRSPAVGVPVLPCSGMPIRSGACGRVLRDLPEGLPTSGMSVEEFATAGPVRQLRRGEVICAVGDCPRPCRNNSITLCQVHDDQRKRLIFRPRSL